MTHIEQMIQDMCPNGVEWKSLGEVCEMKRGSTITANQAEDGDIPVIAGGQKPAYFHNQSNREGKNITVAGSGAYAGYVAYWEQPIFVSDAFTVTPKEAFLDIKFVYYFLTNIQDKIYHTKKGSGVPHVHPSSIADFEIPLPPLEIQKKIVECLDKFSALAAELQAELQKRRTQYEYYRTRLLTPPQNISPEGSTDDRNWEWKTLEEICYSIRTGLNPRKFFRLNTEDATNYYITIREIQNNCIVTTEKTDRMNDEALTLIQKRSNIEKGDLLFSGTGTIGQMYVVTETPRNWGIKEGIYVLKPKAQCVLTKFLYYILATDYISKKINDKVAGGIVMSIPMKELMAISIPLPSIEEQSRIVSILDKFEALTTSLSEGIPAEQAAQQKRYEYYRDLLLTFDRKTV